MEQYSKEQCEQIYKELMGVKSYSELPKSEAIGMLGGMIDISSDLGKREGLERAITELQGVLATNLQIEERMVVNYFMGNAWSCIWVLAQHKQGDNWSWEQPEVENEIRYYRTANRLAEVAGQRNEWYCQSTTNLANAFSQVGRFVEALENWDTALGVNAAFGMAMANKGYGLIFYGQHLYDGGHRRVFNIEARQLLRDGINAGGIHQNAKEMFLKALDGVEAGLGADSGSAELELDAFPLGRGKREREYRMWCLKNRLFLNPLNDLGVYRIAARDVLTCPSLVEEVGQSSGTPPLYFGYFNQLKQEFVSARCLYYEGLHSEKVHYSDRDVLLYNTLDYPCHSYAVEKMKCAYRMAYSILDKIGYFVNEYLALNIAERNVSFRRLWYENTKKRELRKEFECLSNWPFRGLFWLAKDIAEGRPEFSESIEPDARDLASIRNHLEHKYLLLHEYGPIEGALQESASTCSISRDDFVTRTMKMLKLARAALVYLALGTHIEERKKIARHTGKGIIAPMLLDKWEDSWKL